MATTFPNTSNFKPKTFTDFSLQTDNDVSLSTKTLTGEIFTTPFDTISTRLSDVYTRTYNPNTDTIYNALGTAVGGWVTGSHGDMCDFTYEIFEEVPSPSYVQELSDTNNNFRFITKWTGSESPGGGLELSDETIGRGFIAPYDGLYNFNITAEGEAKNISNEDGKGGYLNLKLIKYTKDNLNNPNTPTDPQVIFETLPTPIILTSSQYNFKQVPPTTKLKNYADTEEYSIFNIDYNPVPLTLLDQNNANLSTEVVNYNGNPSTRVLIPHSGSYTFDIKVGGHASVETRLVTPAGYQGDYTTENEIFVVKLQLNIARQDGSVETMELGSQEINIGGINFPTSTSTPFLESKLFSLIEPFSTSDLELDLDVGDAVYLTINVLAQSNNTHRDFYTQSIGFNVRLTSEFFRVSPDSFLKLKSYNAHSHNNRMVYFNLSGNGIEIPLREGDAVTFGLRLRGISKIDIVDETGIGGPLVPGTFDEKHQNIQAIRLYSSSLPHPGTTFIVDQALNNPYLSGQYAGQPSSKGDQGHYQPIYGSFYVDLSEVEAIDSHPVKVQIPLYGIDKFSPNETLISNENTRLIPTSRRFLNNSIEINLTTTQNISTNLFGSDQLTSTNATHGCNFFHWGGGYSSIFYNSALLTRFDRVGSGFTEENINNALTTPSDDIVNISDIVSIDFGQGSIFGIYEGGADIDTSNIPEGALSSPRVVMLKEPRLENQGRAVIVQPAKPVTAISPFSGYWPPQLGEYEEVDQKCSPTPYRHQITKMLERNLGWSVYTVNVGDTQYPLVVSSNNPIGDALWWRVWPGSGNGYLQIQNPGFKRYEFFHHQNKEISFVYQPPPDANGELPPPLLANVTRPTHIRKLINDGVATYVSAENFAEAYNSVVFSWAQTVYGQEGDTLTDVNFNQLPFEVVQEISQNSHYLYNPHYIDLDAYPRDRPPTITPYLDQIQLQGFDNGNPITGNPCWKTASNSPANFFPLNEVSDPVGGTYTSNVYGGGNRFGPDTLHNVQNYYEVPHTGYYNLAYMFDMVVMSYGGDMSNTGTGYPNSRGWQFPNEVMFSYQTYPLPHEGDPLLGGDYYVGSIEWWQATQGNAYYEQNPALCNNTLYGVLKRIPAQGYPSAPSTQVIPGDIAGVPRVIITSSLGRVSDFDNRVGTQMFTQTGYEMISGFIDQYGRQEMYHWVMSFNNEMALINDSTIVDNWINVDRNWLGISSNNILGLNQTAGYLNWSPRWQGYLSDGSSIIMEYNPNYVFDDADGGDVFLDGTLSTFITSQDGANLTSDFLLPMLGTYGNPNSELSTQTTMDLNQWWENFRVYQATANQGESSTVGEGFMDAALFIREFWSINDNYVIGSSYGYDPANGINPLEEFVNNAYFGNGIFDENAGWASDYWDGTTYEDLLDAAANDPEIIYSYQAFLEGASELNLFSDGQGGFYWGFNEDWTIEDINTWIIKQLPEETQSRYYTFKNEAAEETAALARVDRLISSANAWAQKWASQVAFAHGQQSAIYSRLDLGNYNPGALGSAIVADSVNTYLVKGDKVFFEIALGPMMDSYGNLPWGQDTFPDPNTPISGSHKRVSSIGGAFIMENSIASITPLRDYESTFTPNLEFIVTRNNNNIVKGTYKYY